jgi:hypothetical protein
MKPSLGSLDCMHAYCIGFFVHCLGLYSRLVSFDVEGNLKVDSSFKKKIEMNWAVSPV